MIDHILFAHASNLHYLRKLVKDLSPEQMIAQPVAGVTMNHAAWSIGHLIGSQNFALTALGGQALGPAGYGPLFAPGTKPSSEPGAYPGKEELMGVLEQCHAAVAQAVKQAPADVWGRPFPVERMVKYWPTVGDGVVYLITVHDAAHLGQISMWRRAMGLPSVM